MPESTRIRYTNDNGVFKTKPFVTINGGTVTGIININNCTVSVVDDNGTELYHEGFRVMTKAKKLLKASLKASGVSFFDEVRAKRKVEG